MSQKVHCGRLILKDGVLKQVALPDGGGIRDCILSHIDMGFDEIHDKLRELYEIDPTDRNSKLHDFKQRVLDTNRYRTFFEYVHQNGLKFRSTLLYLCTPADHHDSFCFSTPDKNRTSTQATLQIPQVEADSSTSPEVIQLDRNPSPDYKPTTDSLLNNRMVHNLHISSTTSFSNYSFERSLNEFIEYVRNILHQYHHESVFIKLFEYLCTLQGLSSITLDRLKVQIQPTDEHDKEFYRDALDKIEKILRSIKVLIDLNKMRISHIDQQSIIVDLFNQFQHNFNIIHDQWNNTTTNNQRSTSTSSTNRTNDRAPSKSSSSTHHSTTASNHANDTAPSRSTSSTYRSTNTAHHTTDPTSSKSASSTNHSTTANKHTNDSTSSSSVSSKHYPTTTSSSSSRDNPTSTPSNSSSRNYSSSRSFSSGNYPATSTSRNYPTDRASSGNYPADRASSGNYPADRASSGNYPADRASSGNYPADRASSGNYPTDRTSSGNYSVDPRPRTSFSSRNHSNDRTSSRYRSENDSRKQSRALSTSPHHHHHRQHHHHQSTRMTTEELNKNEKDSLFRNLYKSLHCLSEVLHNLGFRSFYETVKRIVYEIGVCQSNINLFEKESLEQAIGIITSIEQRLSNRIQDERHHASPHAIPRKLEETSDTILDAIKNLLNSFEYYKSKINSTKRPRKSRWSPPDVPSTNTQEYTESKPAIHSNQHQSRNNENDDYDDQSSEASRSSFGDEVLMEVARDAYEQRPNHHK